MRPLRAVRLFVSLLAVSLLSGTALRAHDFWIEPSSFTPAPGQRIAVRLRVGQGFRGDPVPRDSVVTERFAAVSAAGELPVLGVRGGEPAGYAAFAAPGLYVLVYGSSPSAVELEGAKFERYLADEGLERISALRKQRGQTAAAAHELFSRCAKSLIAVGSGPRTGYDGVLGLSLELVPELDPSGLPAGGELPLRLLYRGKPLAGTLVTAMSHDRPEAKVSARTDRSGRVRLPIDHAGDWLVKAVHMIPAAAGSGADWESFWASLTFQRSSR